MSAIIFDHLIEAAKQRMARSRDPVHDHAHAARVARYVETLARDMRISKEHTRALMLAAWWHDVARIITDNPSFIWMPVVDDLLSALMLWWHTVQTGTTSRMSGLAVRLIACKSIGAGAFLTRILIRKRNRVLIDILHDGDTLDVFTIERMKKVLELMQSSRIYRVGYRVSCHWYCLLNHIKMKTAAAKKYIIQLLRQFLSWLKEPHIYFWHVEQFGASWAKRNLRRLERIVGRLTLDAVSATL